MVQFLRWCLRQGKDEERAGSRLVSVPVAGRMPVAAVRLYSLAVERPFGNVRTASHDTLTALPGVPQTFRGSSQVCCLFSAVTGVGESCLWLLSAKSNSQGF